jgi:hypothetical protein
MSRENASAVPDFLSADSPQGLRRLMRLNNARRGAWHRYDIMFVNGRWIAWYYPDKFLVQEQVVAVQEMAKDLKDE